MNPSEYFTNQMPKQEAFEKLTYISNMETKTTKEVLSEFFEKGTLPPVKHNDLVLLECVKAASTLPNQSLKELLSRATEIYNFIQGND